MSQLYISEVIVTRLVYAGKGTEESPNRVITQLWTKEGEIIAQYDPFTKEGWFRPEVVEGGTLKERYI